MAGVCGGGRTLARGPGAARAHAAAAAQRGRAQPCLAALRARRSTCAAASSNGSSANGNGTSSSNGSGAPGLHAAPGPLAAAGSAAPQPAGSADAPAARPAALSSRDGAAARSAKRLQTHARRELLSRAWAVVAGGAADVARFRGARSITPPARVAAREAHVAAGAGDGRGEAIGDVIGRMLYNYYLWRQNTLNDLQLIVGLSTSLLFVGAWVRHTIINAHTAADGAAVAAAAAAAAAGGGADGGAAAAAAVAGGMLSPEALAWWQDAYQVMMNSFGESFPSVDADPVEQLFSILVAVFGLAAFALVLALVEQVVLEANNRNVKRGSRVYETGHYLILGWCNSQRDLEMVIKVVQQICLAYRHDGGTSVVVLTQREKLEMEDIFRRAVPKRDRYGSRLVFRQGSPLVPADLQLVAASRAGATVIISDRSRSAAEADAQVVRCAILLDELDGYVGLRHGIAMGHVVAEIQTKNSLPLLHYSCSPRVVALPTGQLNARRLSKMVKRPFISWVSQRMFNFENRSTNYVQSFPSLVGCRFGELAYRFPDGSVYGVAQTDRGNVELNPPIDYVLRESDQLVISRPTDVAVDEYAPLPTTLSISELEALAESGGGGAGGGGGGGWEGERPGRRLDVIGSWRVRRAAPRGRGGADGGGGGSGSPSPGGSPPGTPVTGGGEAPALLWATMLDGSPRSSIDFESHAATISGYGPLAVPPATAPPPGGGAAPAVLTRVPLDSLDLPAEEPVLLSAAANGFGASTPGAAAAQWDAAAAAGPQGLGALGGSFDAGDAFEGRGAAAAAAAAAAEGQGLLAGLEWGRRLVPAAYDAGGGVRVSTAFIPTEYVEHDDKPQKVLIAGWAGAGYMADILAELDAGTACLPRGSEVVFVNDHNRSATMGQVLLGLNLQNVKVSHVKMDPLQRAQVARLDLSSFKCAIVLCDEQWVDPDCDESNGIESADEPSMLRLDALMMTVQLNIRKTLADDGLPPINIICQKVAAAGLTRFEDRHRLPLGISVNFTSFAAKMMAVVAYNPIALLVYARLGESADLTFVDAQEYADVGECISYWELISRAQQQGDLLMGWYRLPDRIDEPIESIFNPQGLEVRGRKRVWNAGDGRLKFKIFRDKEAEPSEDEVEGEAEEEHDPYDLRQPPGRAAGAGAAAAPAAAARSRFNGATGTFSRVR